MKIFCVIPAFNEARTILKVINEVRPRVSRVVVVDDGSEDETLVLVKGAGVTVLRHIVNRGQGAALKTGTLYALSQGADIIIHFDADGQFLAEEIEKIIAPIKQAGAEAVFGSRFLNDNTNMPLLKKKVIMPLARLVNRLFLGVKFSDPQNGFRAMTARAARLIDWQQDGMAHCSEILFSVVQTGLKTEEIPVTVIYRDFGQRLAGGFRILKELLMGALIK